VTVSDACSQVHIYTLAARGAGPIGVEDSGMSAGWVALAVVADHALVRHAV
jgi:hypothetical protein